MFDGRFLNFFDESEKCSLFKAGYLHIIDESEKKTNISKSGLKSSQIGILKTDFSWTLTLLF